MTEPNNEKAPEVEAAEFQQTSGFNAKERLICSHLISAVDAAPLDVALHTTQAALLLDDATLTKLSIDKDTVLAIYTVAYRLANPEKTPDRQGYTDYSVFLGSLNFKDYLKPWFNEHIFIRGPEAMHEKMKNARDLEKRMNIALQHLTGTGYHSLVADFMLWSAPIIGELSGKLAQLVSPDTYMEMFKAVRGVPREAV